MESASNDTMLTVDASTIYVSNLKHMVMWTNLLSMKIVINLQHSGLVNINVLVVVVNFHDAANLNLRNFRQNEICRWGK